MKTKLPFPIVFLFLALVQFSCGDPCKNVTCQNGGLCYEGECSCRNGWVGENCETDPCENLFCQNDGDCESGVCACEPGYFGTVCEFRMSNNFVGDWSVDQTCTQTGGSTNSSQYNLSIIAGNEILEMSISSIPGVGGPIEATIIDENSFLIPQQTVNGFVISGGGAQFGENKLEINHLYYNGIQNDCEAILERR